MVAANAACEQWWLSPSKQQEILAVSVAGHRFTARPADSPFAPAPCAYGCAGRPRSFTRSAYGSSAGQRGEGSVWYQ